jgi:hypothetical protein
MAQVDRMATQVSDNLATSVGRVGKLALGVSLFAGVVGAATWFTGMLIFDNTFRVAWLTLGFVMCAAPCVAALIGWWFVRRAAKSAPALVADVKSLLGESGAQARLLIDHDSGQPLGSYTKSLGDLRNDLFQRRKELPALFAGVRAVSSVPGLAAVAVLGTFALGILGTVLLIGAVID